MDDYLRDFVQESEENITELNNALLTLERDPDDPEAMDRVFRMAHTLKGNCGAMGFENAADLAHAIEDRLDDLRAGRLDADGELMDRIFEGVDELEAMVAEVRDHGEPVSDPAETIQDLRAAGPESTLDTPTTDEIEGAIADIERPSDRTHNVYHVRLDVVDEPGVNNALAVAKALDDAFDLLGTVPERGDIEAGTTPGPMDAVFATAVTETAITAALDPVDAVEGAIITEVTERVELPPPESRDTGGSEDAAAAAGAAAFVEQADLDSEQAREMDVDDLLGEFDEYDDLDALVDEVDDVEGLDDLGDAGTFDDVKAGMGTDDGGASAEAGADDFDDLFEEDEAPAETADESPQPDEEDVEDATETFKQLKSEVEPVGFEELQTELEDLEFDEYSDEEEVGFEELLTEEEMAGDTFEAGREPTDEALDDILVNESVDDLDDEEAGVTAGSGAAGDATAEADTTADPDTTAEVDTTVEADAADATEAAGDDPTDVTAADAFGDEAFGDDAFGDDDASAFEDAVDAGAVDAEADAETDADSATADAAAADQDAVDDAFAGDAFADDAFDAVNFDDEIEADTVRFDDDPADTVGHDADDESDVGSVEEAADDEAATADPPDEADADFVAGEAGDVEAEADTAEVDAETDTATADADAEVDSTTADAETDTATADADLEVEEPAVDPAPEEAVELEAPEEPTTADEDPFAADDAEPAETDTDQETVTAADATVEEDAGGDDFGTVDEVESSFDASEDLDSVAFGDEAGDTDLSVDESDTATAGVDTDTEPVTADDTVGEDVTADEVIESVDTSEFSVDEDDSDVAPLDSPAAADELATGTDDLATGFDDDPTGVDDEPPTEGGFAEPAVDESVPDRDVDIEALLPTPPHELAAGEEGGGDGTESVRVDVDQIDELMNLVEGLVTSRARLRRGVESGESMAVLDDELDDLEALTSELQDTVMDVRLVPIGTVTNRIPRVVRDISREQGKEVAFDIEGEDVEVDRSILDDMRDPLMHLVRNAVDHGIEPPAEREAAGKDPEGAVSLIARRSRDNVVIEVIDDGRGLDADALRAEAIEEGVLTEDEAEAMDDESAYELIFHPGLSTTEEVTDVSGRGVGMDVVKSTVDDLDGSVDVESTVGNGTTISLTLPVSVAISEVLFVESGGEEYGIPLKAVDEVGRMGMVEEVDGEEMLVRGDEQFPLIRLSEALDTPGPGRNGDGMLVRVTDEGRTVAVHCDEVRGQQEVVVKPFEDLLGDIPGLSGATVLGEGDVVNILDVKSL